MNNKYILMRHGETRYQEENILAIYSKEESSSISVTEKAKEKIRKVAKELKEKGIDIIYSSPYKRTKQTAEIIAKEIGKDIIFDERLVDIRLGVLHGKHTDTYFEIYLKERNFFNKPEKGESWEEVQNRVIDFVKEIDKKYKDKKILIVSHGDPIWLLVGFLKNVSNEDLFEKRGKYFGEYKGFYAGTGQFIEV